MHSQDGGTVTPSKNCFFETAAVGLLIFAKPFRLVVVPVSRVCCVGSDYNST